MKLITLTKFNNYFNRKVKYYSTTADYLSESDNSFEFNDVNFNPNDGVNSQQIINYIGTDTPDYLLVVDGDTIISRWFILDWVRNRGQQYTASIRRDVVADNLNSIKTSPCFIERGPLLSTNKLIYNPEGVTLNQMKVEETLLQDTTKKAWIVGYLANNYPTGTTQKITSRFNPDTYPTVSSLGIQVNPETKVGHLEVVKGSYIKPILAVRQFNQATYNIYSQLTPDSMSSALIDEVPLNSGWNIHLTRIINIGAEYTTVEAIRDHYQAHLTSALQSNIVSHARSYISLANPGIELDEENLNKVRSNPIVRYAGNYYSIRISEETTEEQTVECKSSTDTAAIHSDMVQLFNAVRAEYDVPPWDENTSTFWLKYDKLSLTIVLEEVSLPGELNVTLSSTRKHLDDAPYDMFCMEYDLSTLALAQSMVTTIGKENVYDLQILPYCPARFIFDGTGTTLINHEDYEIIYNGDTETSLRLYYCRHSSDTFIIDTKINIVERTADAALNIKLSNECDYYRLTAPNYSSSFEMNVAKNGGINGFKVTYTYRPISPYIHIQPIFSGLYGSFNADVRGLICGGDYSIDTITDAFTQYQVQNKNYQNIFNTEIKKMDDIHKIDRENAIWGVAAGTVQGAATGGATGAMIGGGLLGAGIGAVAGAGVSLAGGIKDLQNQEKAYGINRQYSVDMYNYGLGNVRALPNTLAKVSAYNIDNKYFPVFEYYTCTEEEVEILKNKLQYQSYTIMGLMKIQDLPTTGDSFVKGQIVRLENFAEDNHLAEEIYSEIAKGVYL